MFRGFGLYLQALSLRSLRCRPQALFFPRIWHYSILEVSFFTFFLWKKRKRRVSKHLACIFQFFLDPAFPAWPSRMAHRLAPGPSRNMVLWLIRTLMAPNLDPRASPGSFFQDGSPGKSQILPKLWKWIVKNQGFPEKSAKFCENWRNSGKSTEIGRDHLKQG